MVNHILHPLEDRTLCEPYFHDASAPFVSVGADAASCPACIAAWENGPDSTPGLSDPRRAELARRLVLGETVFSVSAAELSFLLDRERLVRYLEAQVPTCADSNFAQHLSQVLQDGRPPSAPAIESENP